MFSQANQPHKVVVGVKRMMYTTMRKDKIKIYWINNWTAHNENMSINPLELSPVDLQPLSNCSLGFHTNYEQCREREKQREWHRETAKPKHAVSEQLQCIQTSSKKIPDIFQLLRHSKSANRALQIPTGSQIDPSSENSPILVPSFPFKCQDSTNW